MDKDLLDDPRIVALTDLVADELTAGNPTYSSDHFRQAACNAVIGGIYRLWRYADTHLKRYDRLNLALHGVATVTGLSVTVLRKFPREWLIEHNDGTVELPGYSDKNALIDKDNRREKTRERVRRWRARKRKEQPDAVKHARNGHGVTGASLPDPDPDPGPGPYPPNPGPDPGAASLAAAQGATAAPRKSFDETFRERFGHDPVRAKGER